MEKQFPFTKQDILNELNNKWNDNLISVDFGECNSGCGSSATHKYYYVRLNWTEFQDNGNYTYVQTFIQAVQDLFSSMEKELAKENIVFSKETKKIAFGRDSWGHIIYQDMECVNKIVKIVPSKSFIVMQKWLKNKANFDLGLTDLYACSICQKRSSKSYGSFNYYAQREDNFVRAFEKIKSAYKSGNKVSAEIVSVEDMEDYNSNRYEYEQYGTLTKKLVVTISTPSGRKTTKIEI